LLREWKVGIVCFQETKREALSRSVVRSLWGCNNVDWCCLDSRRASGGVLRRVGQKDRRIWGSSPWLLPSETLTITSLGLLQVSMALTSIRRLLWEELAGISWWNLPWCIGAILMLPGSPLIDQEAPAYAQL